MKRNRPDAKAARAARPHELLIDRKPTAADRKGGLLSPLPQHMKDRLPQRTAHGAAHSVAHSAQRVAAMHGGQRAAQRNATRGSALKATRTTRAAAEKATRDKYARDKATLGTWWKGLNPFAARR